MYDNVHDLFPKNQEEELPDAPPRRKEPSMRDWTGSTIQQEALAVPCRYCGAQIGDRCVRDEHPLRAFPAHTSRITDARKGEHAMSTLSRDETSMPGVTPPSPGKSAQRGTRAQKPPPLIECSGCENRWTGLSACHCSGCHRTFTGLTAFDIHRVGGECSDPATLFNEKGEPRLVPVEKAHWSGWRVPGDMPEDLW